MKLSILKALLLAALVVSPAVYAEEAPAKAISVKSGQKIAFLGDSITAAGARKGGYCQLVIEGLKKEGVEGTGVFAGISGHKSDQMLARLEKDVLSKNPNWMTLSSSQNWPRN